MKKTLILGPGDVLMRDDGLGVRAVERLQALYQFPKDVQVLDGGTLGLDLLPIVEAAEPLLVIDALELSAEPGTLARLEGDYVPAFLSIKISPHQMGLADLSPAARQRGSCPGELVLWGVQPETTEPGLDLSPGLLPK